MSDDSIAAVQVELGKLETTGKTLPAESSVFRAAVPMAEAKPGQVVRLVAVNDGGVEEVLAEIKVADFVAVAVKSEHVRARFGDGVTVKAQMDHDEADTVTLTLDAIALPAQSSDAEVVDAIRSVDP